MSLEKALEENTAALQEFTVYIKLALDTVRMASVPGPLISKPYAQPLLEQVEKGNQYPNHAPVVETKKPVAEASPKVTAAVLPVIESAAPVTQLTLAEVGLAITAAAKLDRAKVVRVLAEFGCMRGSDLTADQYANFVKALS